MSKRLLGLSLVSFMNGWLVIFTSHLDKNFILMKYKITEFSSLGSSV